MTTHDVSKAVVRWSFLTSVALFMVGLVYVGYRGDQNDKVIDRNTLIIQQSQVRIEKLTADLRVAVHQQCLETQTAAYGINTVLDTLITATQGFNVSATFTRAERDNRIKKYELAKMKIPACKEMT